MFSLGLKHTSKIVCFRFRHRYKRGVWACACEWIRNTTIKIIRVNIRIHWRHISLIIGMLLSELGRLKLAFTIHNRFLILRKTRRVQISVGTAQSNWDFYHRMWSLHGFEPLNERSIKSPKAVAEFVDRNQEIRLNDSLTQDHWHKS